MQDWKRLGQYVVARRVDLGFKRRSDFADARQVSVRILSDIENGRRTNFDQATIASLERALGWETGSALRVVEGGEPRTRAGDQGADLIGVDDEGDPAVVQATYHTPESGLPDEIDMIYRSNSMTAQQKLEAIRMVLHLRAQVDKESAAATSEVEDSRPQVSNGS